MQGNGAGAPKKNADGFVRRENTSEAPQRKSAEKHERKRKKEQQINNMECVFVERKKKCETFLCDARGDDERREKN